MPIPNLPLIDNCLFIDNSSWMEGMSACYRYLQYKSLNRRIPAAEKPSLNFGSAIHLALEYRYKTYRNQPVDTNYYNELATILTQFYTEHPVPDGEWRTLNWAMEIIRRYNERYAIEPFSLLVNNEDEPLVELSFALPLYKHKDITIIYSGRIDLPVMLDGNVYVMDHKTTSMMGSPFWDEMRITAQQRGYVWAFEQLTGKKVNGYIINAIRTKEPPFYVMAGKPSSKGTKTSPEQWWNESLNRERFLIKPGEIDEWKHNTIDLVEEFFWHYERGYMPMKTKWCSMYGKCPYYEVCQLAPSDRDMLLYSGRFTDNTWSPLQSITQAKQ